MFPDKSMGAAGASKKKPAFLRKKAPMPPSDGAEDADEMSTTSEVTCPECGCEFDPASTDEA
jgi:hypothetical protein